MKHSLQRLPNDLRVLTVPMPSLKSATLTVWVKTGSRYEEPTVAGISHFLEHMAFKGGNKYRTAKQVAEAVDAIGGEFNAGTSKEWTNFYIRCSAEKIEIAYDVLSDMLLSPRLLNKDIEREKGVIVEEIHMYDDTPMFKIGDFAERLVFGANSLGRDIIGKSSTVRSLTRSDFVKYRDIHYFAENMLISVSGGVTAQQIFSLSEKYFSKLASKGKPVVGPAYKGGQKTPRVFISPKESEQAQIALAFPAFKLDNPHRFAEYLLATILGDGMSSRLFTEVREKRGLAYSVNAGVEHFIETGYFGIFAGIDPRKADEAIQVILSELYKLSSKKHGLAKAELAKAKAYRKGHYALALENTRSVNSIYGHEELLLGKLTTPEEDMAAIDSVTIGEVLDVARQVLVPERLNLAIIGPYKDRERFVKLVT